MKPAMWRVLALLIAIAALIDPAFTSSTTSRPAVSVVAAGARNRANAAVVSRALSDEFTVVDGLLPGAAATVIVGDRVPHLFNEITSPVFAVSSGGAVAIAAVTAPGYAPLDSRVPVVVDVRVRQHTGDSITLTLKDGDAVLDRSTGAVSGNDTSVSLTTWFVPAAAGARHLRVTANVGRSNDVADVVVEVRDQRWPVLFFDRRPSWTSTFVRRALERDPAFIVTSRIVTSRNVSTDAGQPPESFDDVAAGERFDAVVVGAPELLTSRDVAGLDAFMRRRGGSVVLLFDTQADGPSASLTQVQRWSVATVDSASVLVPVNGEPGNLMATELSWPAVVPPGAEGLVSASPSARDSTTRAVIWRSPVGAGRLIVNGALDAWVYRDTASSAFDAFWRRTIAEAAAATPPPLSVQLTTVAAEPESRMEIEAISRVGALGQSPTDGSPLMATIEPGGSGSQIALWPMSNGVYRGTFRAPSANGLHTITVASGTLRAAATFVVDSAASDPANPAGGFGEWIAARGGRIVPPDSLSYLAAAVRDAVDPKAHAERWFPMRSAWWIIPFSLALGAEWWWRRRGGLV
jgi:hypothetical protein